MRKASPQPPVAPKTAMVGFALVLLLVDMSLLLATEEGQNGLLNVLYRLKVSWYTGQGLRNWKLELEREIDLEMRVNNKEIARQWEMIVIYNLECEPP